VKRAASLMSKGMSQVQDIWDLVAQSFIPWLQVKGFYGLLDFEIRSYERIVNSIAASWICFLTDYQFVTRKDEFLGGFPNDEDLLPSVVFNTSAQFRLRLVVGIHAIELPSGHLSFTIGQASLALKARPRVFHQNYNFSMDGTSA